MAQSLPFDRIRTALRGFVAWLDRYGETSYDFQSFFAGSLGRGAKALYYRKPLLGTLAVATISHRGRSLRNGLCVPLADARRASVSAPSRAFPRGPRGGALPRLRA